MEARILAALRSTQPDDPLARALQRFVAVSSTAHPDLQIPLELLAAHLARLFPDLASDPSALETIHAADLYLACAASAHDPKAIARLDAAVMPAATRLLTSMRQDGPTTDELLQRLRHRLLVGGPRSEAALLGYAGLSELAAFASVIAARLALDLRREQTNEHRLHERATESERGDERLARGTGWGDGPEASLIKSEHRALFKQAFAEAVGELAARERAILRMHYVDGSSIDDIGRVYRMHGATAARHIQAARATLIAKARVKLVDALGDELSSTMALVESQIDLSLSRLLD